MKNTAIWKMCQLQVLEVILWKYQISNDKFSFVKLSVKQKCSEMSPDEYLIESNRTETLWIVIKSIQDISYSENIKTKD